MLSLFKGYIRFFLGEKQAYVGKHLVDGDLIDAIKVAGASALSRCMGIQVDPAPATEEVVEEETVHISYRNDEALLKRG